MLPARSEQEAIGAAILEDMESERRWQAAFDNSQDRLDELAQKALAEHRGQGGMVMLATHGEMLLDDPLRLQLPDFAPVDGQAAELGWFAP